MKRFLLIALIIISGMLFAGCGSKSTKTDDGGNVKISDKTVEVQDSKGGKGTVSLGNGNVNYQGTDATVSSGQNVKLPDGYPEDILPIYNPDNITLAGKNSGGGFGITYTSKSKKDDVVNHYKDLLKSIKNLNVLDTNGSTYITGQSGKWEIGLVISENPSDSNKTNLVVSLGNK